MSASASPRTRALRWLLASAFLLFGSGTALAQHGGHGGRGGHGGVGGGHFHGGAVYGGHHLGGGGYRMDSGRWGYRAGYDVRGFSRPAFAHWSGGRWNNTCWGGRCGWWWGTGGLWYFYGTPIYPYPLVVSPITYAAPIYYPAQPLVPYAADVSGLTPQPTFSYYCDDPPGYYPAVPQCSTPWHESRTLESPPAELPPPPATKQ